MEENVIYKVIVAEDEPLILGNLVKKINNLNIGFQVIATAEDGKTALKLVKTHLPDVIVTDIRMPIMDGLKLLRSISPICPDIKKVIISGYDDFEYAQEAFLYNTAAYMLKPLNSKELLEIFNRIRIALDAQRDAVKQKQLQLRDDYSYSPGEIASLVEAYIQENYTEDINFDMISQDFNFNSTYLSKIFKEHIGEKPSKYLISMRINKAKYLLRNHKELLIKDIGEMVGYPDQFYFSRIFKSIVGQSPTSFRDGE